MKTLLERIVVNFLRKPKELPVAPKKTLLERIAVEFLVGEALAKDISFYAYDPEGNQLIDYDTDTAAKDAIADPTKSDRVSPLQAPEDMLKKYGFDKSGQPIEEPEDDTGDDAATSDDGAEDKPSPEELEKQAQAAVDAAADDQTPEDSNRDATNREKDDSLVLKQLKLIKGSKQDAGGAGTASSRTGEAAGVYAVKQIRNCMQKKEGSYVECKDKVQKELEDIVATEDTLLTQEWVDSAMYSLDWLDKNVGLENIDEQAWDTPAGRELLDVEDHGTSSDMFIRLKDGRVIGLSLKQDFSVFIVNGGYGKKIGELGEMLGFKLDELPENIRGDYYNKRRGEILQEGVKELSEDKIKEDICNKFEAIKKDPKGAVAKEVFGTPSTVRKRLEWIAARKEGIGATSYNNRSKEQKADDVAGLTCDDLFKHVVDAEKPVGEDIKVIANLARSSYPELYKELRGLDDEMMDNLEEFLASEGVAEQFKEMVIEQTHITDVLFGSESEKLDGFEVIYGVDGGVSMSPDAVSSMFGVEELYETYKACTKGAEGDGCRAKNKAKIEKQIKERMVVTRYKGQPVIGVNVESKNPDAPPPFITSVLPIFGIQVRTRGIGNPPSLEISQSMFGGLAFKNGNTDVSSWPPEDRGRLAEAEAKAILNDLQSFDLTDTDVREQLRQRLQIAIDTHPSSDEKPVATRYTAAFKKNMAKAREALGEETSSESLRPLLRSLIIRELNRIRNGN